MRSGTQGKAIIYKDPESKGRARLPVLSSYTHNTEKEKRLLRRQENRVNHMDHTVRGFNVGNNDLNSVVQIDLTIFDGDGDVLAKHGGSAGQVDHVRSHDLAGDHMVGQNIGELLLVLRQEQAVQRAGRTLCIRFFFNWCG